MPIGAADNSNSIWNTRQPVIHDNTGSGNTAPPVVDTGDLEGGGGTDFAGWLSRLGNGASDFLQGSGSRWGSLIPALATAYQQWNDSGKYGDTAREAAGMSAPFSPYRRYYGDLLQSLYQDPSRIAETPGYRFAMQQGIENVGRSNAAKGYLGSGKMTNDQMEFAQGLASQTWDKEADRLGRFAGAQFDDSRAGEMLMRGNEQEIASRNGALAALMYPFGMNSGPASITNNNNNGGQSGSTRQIASRLNGLQGASTIAQEILRISGGMGGSAMDLIRSLLSDPYSNVSDSTRSILEDIALDPSQISQGFDPGSFGGSSFDPGTSGGTWGNNPFGPGMWGGGDNSGLTTFPYDGGTPVEEFIPPGILDGEDFNFDFDLPPWMNLGD